jgi:hypothetical protein
MMLWIKMIHKIKLKNYQYKLIKDIREFNYHPEMKLGQNLWTHLKTKWKVALEAVLFPKGQFNRQPESHLSSLETVINFFQNY